MTDTPCVVSQRVLIAPDSFKGSATACEVACAIAEGWTEARPQDELHQLPLADGGEGTLDAVATAITGTRRVPVTVPGPDGRPVGTHWLALPDGTGLVELAGASGLTLLDRPCPASAHTLGFGRVIAAAMDAGVRHLLLALGGSASTDGGAGALTALGARLLDTAGEPVPLGNHGLARLHSVDLSDLRQPPASGVTVLSDVTHPLLGPTGAAAMFGAQKGFTANGIVTADRNLRRLAERLPADPSTTGTGAAGGTGFGLLAWGADLVAGSELLGRLVGLPSAVAAADVVITGEGRFDGASQAGKAPGHVAALAAATGTQALLIAGQITADGPFLATEDLSVLAGGPGRALADPINHLRRAGTELAIQYQRSDNQSENRSRR
ncbi:glycerate kinase [Sciscionella sediminilitoris]|uniref:glycerate kinase n=1 Tax=Sciscionella sediminilitoris TaxID=1445613 RepID=UPI00068F4B1F|nr:glycerate kinase [Sciscionella sp. SE31]